MVIRQANPTVSEDVSIWSITVGQDHSGAEEGSMHREVVSHCGCIVAYHA